MSYEVSPLWTTTLGGPDDPAGAITRLRTAFAQMRRRAAHLVSEIPQNLAHYTVHDVSHLDALWETASVVAGEHYRLNPMEAFVLGGAILVHDAGMSLAAYPGGLEELRECREWKDTLHRELRSTLKRQPTAAEIDAPPEEVEREVVGAVLRALHADRAKFLATQSWQSPDGQQLWLLEDSALRLGLGRLIGRIASSHHWDVDTLGIEFASEMGAPVGFPSEWSVDALKVACLLRLADASHIDARRAPTSFRRYGGPPAILVITGHSRNACIRYNSTGTRSYTRRPGPFRRSWRPPGGSSGIRFR